MFRDGFIEPQNLVLKEKPEIPKKQYKISIKLFAEEICFADWTIF